MVKDGVGQMAGARLCRTFSDIVRGLGFLQAWPQSPYIYSVYLLLTVSFITYYLYALATSYALFQIPWPHSSLESLAMKARKSFFPLSSYSLLAVPCN